MMAQRVLLFLALFVNGWLVGRSIAADYNETDITALLQAVVVVAVYNLILLAGFLLALFD